MFKDLKDFSLHVDCMLSYLKAFTTVIPHKIV